MAEKFTLSISQKNQEASSIIRKWKHNGINISDIFCDFVIQHDMKQKQLQQVGTTVPAGAEAVVEMIKL